MNSSSENIETKNRRIPLSLGIITSIVLAVLFPLLLVAYEGIIWGGEGLFSFMLVSPILGPVLAFLGIGISIAAYKAENKAKRDKIIKFGSMIYIVFVLIVFVVMSGIYHDALGPITSR